MANVTFPLRDIEKAISLNEKVIEEINMFGTTVESLTKEEICLEVPANRPDLLSMQLFIKAFKTYQGKEHASQHKINHSLKKTYTINVNKNVKPIRPYTACSIVKNLDLKEENIKELIYLQEKLHATIGRQRKKSAIGIYPLDKISFPIRYESRKPSDITFIPLGSTQEMNASQILQRHPAGKAYAKLLNGERFPIFVDAKNNILSMPPIVNSQETGQITSQTKDVFIECSGKDKNVLHQTLNIIVATLAEMGGAIYAVTIKDEITEISPNLSPQTLKTTKENVEKLLGIKMTEKEMQTYLKRMGHEYSKGKVHVSPWRTDILHEVDLIEDIAIAYGYNRIIPDIPKIATSGERLKKSTLRSSIIENLVGLGFLENSSLHMIKAEEAKIMNIQHPLKVSNSRTEYTILRPNMLIPLLRTLSENTNVEYPQKLCEIGRVFAKDDHTETGIREEEHLVIALTPSNFTEAKQTLDYLLRFLNVNYELQDMTSKPFISGRAGSIIVNTHNIGNLGEIHPQTLHDWGLKLPLALIELDLEEIYKLLE